MIRRSDYKFIHRDDDPPLLFDGVNDPSERCNLATVVAYAELCRRFAAEVCLRWDSHKLRADIIGLAISGI